jgi:putative transposase
VWTPATRAQHTGVSNRYRIDLTDAEWALIAGSLPRANSVGRPRAWPAREVMNAIFHVLRGGIAWRLLPTDFPPWQTRGCYGDRGPLLAGMGLFLTSYFVLPSVFSQ